MSDRPPPLILVVDDEAGIRALLSDVLSDLGYEVVAVETGERAIVTARELGKRVALAIIDLVLPGKSGVETLRELRALSPGLPGIISTGDASFTPDPPLAQLAEAERFRVLEKPYRIGKLVREIEVALGVD